jgi:hypothetical protein
MNRDVIICRSSRSCSLRVPTWRIRCNREKPSLQADNEKDYPDCKVSVSVTSFVKAKWQYAPEDTTKCESKQPRERNADNQI